jgi:hypothetical protein
MHGQTQAQSQAFLQALFIGLRRGMFCEDHWMQEAELEFSLGCAEETQMAKPDWHSDWQTTQRA